MMEPMNCTAQVAADRVDLGVGTQNPEGAVSETAELTGVPVENVYLHNCFLGSGFGRRGENDNVRQAVVIAQQLGRAVKAIWCREETMERGADRLGSVYRFSASLCL